jgi:hypothetical protein
MIKPGKRDIKVNILITGQELDELKKHIWAMAESFGLDNRLSRYQGKRPIGLYQWDFECLMAVFSMALDDPKEYPSKDSPEYHTLNNLYIRLKNEYEKTYD